MKYILIILILSASCSVRDISLKDAQEFHDDLDKALWGIPVLANNNGFSKIGLQGLKHKSEPNKWSIIQYVESENEPTELQVRMVDVYLLETSRAPVGSFVGKWHGYYVYAEVFGDSDTITKVLTAVNKLVSH